ncbi:MAG: bifunctional anthranilate synthase component I family protein/class IV aminotransferase, partial [Bacteroidota bacterium]|nr:bifunctional anthranilate synthase component I family protein/class IV aminotransferase [Bacteroidota bacterium]
FITKPMKGTSKRGRTSDEDRQLSQWLHLDEKNRSENLMIVDLLRNDVGRICETGTVKVSDMFAVEQYDTILQMTSTISGEIKNSVRNYDIFKSLFPCGSVTGAPKIRTMQIIHELEQHQRGVYCGAIGYFAPPNEATFSVSIRTIEMNGNSSKGTMGVGSGIVFDSNSEKELEECLLKANFLLQEHTKFQLLETMLWQNGYTFLSEHVGRMKQSADFFSFPLDVSNLNNALEKSERAFTAGKKYRVRLVLSKNGEFSLTSSELIDTKISPVIRIADKKTNSNDRFLFHKTTRRELYTAYSQKASKENIFDYIFLNERNEITEGSFTSLFIEKDGKLFTPPIACGLLNGVYRQHILMTNPSASQKVLFLDDLRTADGLFLCNSIRGWQSVTLFEI